MTRIKDLIIPVIIFLTSSVFPVESIAQDIFVPTYTPEPVFQATSAQKGVGLSTDIITVAMPVATLAGVLIDRDWEGLRQGLCVAGTTAAATIILKLAVCEERPNFSNHHSFPSGHSSISFATAGFLQRRYGWKLGVPAYALATYVAWGRVFSRNHHWWDCVAGAAIGAGSAYLFTRPKKHKTEISLIPVSDGHHHGFSASITF